MKISSRKNALLFGIICPIITILILLGFIHIVDCLTRGVPFYTLDDTRELINGVSLKSVITLEVLLAILVPVLMLKYENRKLLLVYIPISIVFYLLMVILIFYGYISVIDNFADVYSWMYHSPLNSYDAIVSAMVYFPSGSFLGTIISIIINEVRIRKQKTL